MTSTDKYELLDEVERMTEAHLQEAIRYFQNLDHQSLLRSPANGGWSIAQCLDHLNSYGRYYFPRIEKALHSTKKLSGDQPFRSTWMGDLFVRMMDPDRGKMKLKAVRKHRPAVIQDGHAVVSEFIMQREQFMILTRQARKGNLNARVATSISPLFVLKLGDIFRFVATHDERHVRQARRVTGG